MNKRTTFNIWYVLVAFVLLSLLQSWWQSSSAYESISYSEFEKALEDGGVKKVTVSDERVIGEYKHFGT